MLLGGKRFILKWYVLTLFRYQFCVIGKWSASVILVDFSSKVGTGSMIPTDLSRKIMVRICFTGASLDKIAKVDSLDFESSFRELDPSSFFRIIAHVWLPLNSIQHIYIKEAYLNKISTSIPINEALAP